MAKILYVEDYEAQRDFMVWLLELCGGYEVDVACNGEEGVKKVREWHPDVVLMDIRMPGQIDGIAAIRQLRNGPDTVDIPIIAISAWGGFEYKALKAGADLYLAKPVPVDELFAAINRHLRQPSLSQGAFLGSAVERA
ncbi:MAG: response regulator [Anaerolineales bacterium]|nr:MAG: response regulator [Anaerolineales bacterium]